MPAWIAVIFPGPAKYRHCCLSHRLEMTASCAAIFCLFLFCSSVFLSFSLGLVVVAKADTANALGRGFEIIVAFKLLSTAILRCEFLLPRLCQSLMDSCVSHSFLFSFLFLLETSREKSACFVIPFFFGIAAKICKYIPLQSRYHFCMLNLSLLYLCALWLSLAFELQSYS